jgi:RNA polymerase sigma-70 factor (sigma-E family)
MDNLLALSREDPGMRRSATRATSTSTSTSVSASASTPPRPQSDHESPTLEALYAAHRLSLVRLAVLLVDDVASAEDCVQDAFAGLHSRWRRLDDVEKALAYLRTAVVNNARSVLRRRRTARAYVPPHAPPAPSPEGAAVLAEEHRSVLAALDRLAPRQREVLVLRYWSDLTEAQIADTLGLSRGAVKSTASRAIDALEKMLETSR